MRAVRGGVMRGMRMVNVIAVDNSIFVHTATLNGPNYDITCYGPTAKGAWKLVSKKTPPTCVWCVAHRRLVLMPMNGRATPRQF